MTPEQALVNLHAHGHRWRRAQEFARIHGGLSVAALDALIRIAEIAEDQPIQPSNLREALEELAKAMSK